jgi:hypothetical protein
MADHGKERPKNPTLRLAREVSAARLKRAHVTVSKDWSRHSAPQPAVTETFPPELIRRLAGG